MPGWVKTSIISWAGGPSDGQDEVGWVVSGSLWGHSLLIMTTEIWKKWVDPVSGGTGTNTRLLANLRADQLSGP